MTGTKTNLGIAKALGAIDVADSLLNKAIGQGKNSGAGTIAAPMLSKFMAEMKSSKHLMQLSKPYLFFVRFISSDAIFSNANSTTMSFLCHSCSIPGYMVETQSAIISGIPYKVPVGISFPEFTCSFFVDRNYRIPKIFEDHKNSMIDSRNENSSYLVKYKNSFQFQIEVSILDVTNIDSDVVNMYKLKNCFVENVRFDNLDWSAQNQVQQVYLTMNQEYVESISTDKTPNSTAPSAQKSINNVLNKATTALNFDTVKAMSPAFGSLYDTASSYVTKVSDISDKIKLLL